MGVTEREEIIIAGGSLAGMACAIRLKQEGLDPLVVEKSRFPRKKLCGEFLGPDAFPVLRELGLFEQVKAQAWGPVEKVFYTNMRGQSLEIPLRWLSRKDPYALAIPRDRLDWLMMDDGKRLGIRVLEEHRIVPKIVFNEGLFQVRVEARAADSSMTEKTFESPMLIDATGRSGHLSLNGHRGAKRNLRERIGVQCHVRLPEAFTDKHLRMFLFPGGYGGVQPIAEREANVCMQMDAAMARAMQASFPDFIERTIGQNPQAAGLLSGCERVGEFSTTSDINLDLIREKPGQGRLIRLGDALVTVDPFTGSGMAHALETGLLAADCLIHGLAEKKEYVEIETIIRRAYDRRFAGRLRLLRWFRPVLESSRAQAILWPLIEAGPPLLPAMARAFR